MKIVFETDRLILREFIIDDAIHFYHMNANNDVIKYTGDSAFKSVADAQIFLSKYNQYQLFGMGRWAVCMKTNNEFIGWCGLKFHPDEKLVEVGYRFYKKYWRQGFATESTKASLQYGFEILKLKEIYAHAHLKNTASHRVIANCGMQYLNEAIYDNMPAILYRKINPHYQTKTITAKETYHVRHPMLRANKPLSSCKFDGDHDDTTFHLGLFFKNNLVAVVTLLKKINPIFSENNQYQLRGMAVLNEFQKKGLGKLLVSEGEKLLLNKCDRIWLNARKTAVNFYIENGYTIQGKPFQIKEVGIHYTMSKKII